VYGTCSRKVNLWQYVNDAFLWTVMCESRNFLTHSLEIFNLKFKKKFGILQCKYEVADIRAEGEVDAR